MAMEFWAKVAVNKAIERAAHILDLLDERWPAGSLTGGGNMKALSVLTAIMATACVVTLGFSQQSVRADREGRPDNTAASISVTNADVLPDNPALVVVFIPTGSNSVECFVTQNDTTFVAFGTQTFCALRQSPVYGSGVVVTIDYFQTVPP